MDIAWINIGLAFLEGIALIISPCIWPILPIILSGSLTGNKSRPLGIIAGFVITFAIVTLFSKAIIDALHIHPETIRNVSFFILIFLGLVMMSTYLTEKFNLLTQGLTGVGQDIKGIHQPQSGFFGGLIFGGLVGFIWTPCAGPILAAIIVQVVIQQTTFNSVLIVIAFAIGAGLPMLLIALIGREVLEKVSFIRDHTVLIRKILGVIIIASTLFLMFSSGAAIPFVNEPSHQANISSPPSALSLINGLQQPYPAPAIAGIDAWINSAPLSIDDLKGKVILIDFWTYTCINCIRTLPYIKDWYAKYHDKGLVIIGIHSPEFQFEHDLNNVKRAVIHQGILYPVALDNRFITWQNFQNQSWPAHYLINKEGNVVYTHFGEGKYDVTENNIRYLLGLTASVPALSTHTQTSSSQTPEIYLGYSRANGFISPEPFVKNQAAIYSYPPTLAKNSWALKGKWIIYPEKIVAASADASIKLHFIAGKVYAVMGGVGKKIIVKLNVVSHDGAGSSKLNPKLLIDQGHDVSNRLVEVTSNRLYTVVNLKREGERILELTATQAGLEMYTFTFGA